MLSSTYLCSEVARNIDIFRHDFLNILTLVRYYVTRKSMVQSCVRKAN
jgi:hypothetical protein